ncbi:MAG: tyrosine-protein kinase domain-containing protein [Acidimicrobiales bacterium]
MAAVGRFRGEPQLLAYTHTLWRRKWAVIVVTLLSAGAALGFAERQTPTYNATANVLLQPSASSAVIAGAAGTPVPNVPDEILRIESSGVAALVRAQIGSAPPISAVEVGTTNVIAIEATSTLPARAALVANAYANAYVDYSRRQTVTNLLGAAKDVQKMIDSTHKQIARLQNQVSNNPAAPQGAAQAQLSALTQQLAVLIGQMNSLQSNAVLQSSAAQVIDPAVRPSTPTSPRKAQDVLLGFGGGLFLGLALAFLRGSLDDSISSKDDLNSAQPGLPVLAQIPLEPHPRHTIVLAASSRPHSAGAEAYRSLRTSVQFLTLEQSLRTLQITSPRSGEGKTTTLANLATTLAGAGQQVVLVDCDLRRPRLHEPFGLTNKVGFTSVVLGETPLSAALQDVTGHDGLRLLASGPRLSNPSEVLSSQRTAEILASLAGTFDLVLIDSPPVIPVTDAVALAPKVDATLLVVLAGTTTAKDLARSLEVLGQVDAPVVGAVLNAVPTEGHYRYGGHHYGEYRYLDTPEQQKKQQTKLPMA